MPYMAKAKDVGQSGDEPLTPTINFRPSAELHRRLSDWIDQQRVKPTKTAVIIQALEEFLDREEQAAKATAKK